MSTYPLTVQDRKKNDRTFEDRAALVASLEEGIDTVTAGKIVASLPQGEDLDLWLLLYDNFGTAARLKTRLGRVIVGFLNRAAREGDEDAAEAAHQRIGGEQDFDEWWNEKQAELATTPSAPQPTPTPAIPVGGLDLPEMEDGEEVEGGPVAVTVLDGNPAEEPKPKTKPKAPRQKPTATHTAAGLPRKNRMVRKAQDEGPKDRLGKVQVETRSYVGLADDYYGDGSYKRTCPNCRGTNQETGTYDDFGPRVMEKRGNEAKVVQPQCRVCRREASKVARQKKKQEQEQAQARRAGGKKK